MIHVCSLARLHDTLRETGARHVVTLIKDISLVHRPASITPENHLLLDMDDITDHIDGYVAPHDMLAGRAAEIHAARDRKLEEARHQRQLRRAAVSMLAHSANATTMTSPGETEAGSAGMQPC